MRLHGLEPNYLDGLDGLGLRFLRVGQVFRLVAFRRQLKRFPTINEVLRHPCTTLLGVGSVLQFGQVPVDGIRFWKPRAIGVNTTSELRGGGGEKQQERALHGFVAW